MTTTFFALLLAAGSASTPSTSPSTAPAAAPATSPKAAPSAGDAPELRTILERMQPMTRTIWAPPRPSAHAQLSISRPLPSGGNSYNVTTQFEVLPEGVAVTFTGPPNYYTKSFLGQQFYPGDDVFPCPDEPEQLCWRRASDEGAGPVKYREHVGLWELWWVE